MAAMIEVLSAFRNSCVKFKTLKPQRFAPEDIFVGNHTVVCRAVMEDTGEVMSLKCFPRKRRNASAIYGKSFLPEEAGVYTLNNWCEYLDIVAEPWIDGETVDVIMESRDCDYALISRAFDRMAIDALRDTRTHGDIQPRNLILTPQGDIHLIDYDAAWVPGLKFIDLEEIGAPNFGHPKRLGKYFDAYMDDYPIAILSVMFAALSYDREKYEQCITHDFTVFNTHQVYMGADKLLEDAVKLFERHRDTVHLKIASSLAGNDGRIAGLAEMLEERFKTPL